MKRQAPELIPGTKLTGKWHGQTYRVIKKLGQGATGTVFLVESERGPLALKIGHENPSITSEVNVLQRFSKVQDVKLGPSLIETDDLKIGDESFAFYTMEYIRGAPFFSHINKYGKEWGSIFIVQLLGDLDRLHQASWVFGDLKPDNLLITSSPPRVRWFDVGGTTLMGRSIKEYTEFFDRGYWGLGDRKAEPSYDLFSVAMVMINIAYPHRFEKGQAEGLEILTERIEAHTWLRPYRKVLRTALLGRYTDAQLMKKDMMEIISETDSKKRFSSSTKNRMKQGKQFKKTEGKRGNVWDAMLAASFIILASVLYWVGQLM
nr:hypothetical protein [Salsuginibacillus kocurii]